jgi:hypothetical protein
MQPELFAKDLWLLQQVMQGPKWLRGLRFLIRKNRRRARYSTACRRMDRP